jgi:hypothetical protein
MAQRDAIAPVPPDHPLRRLFRRLTEQTFARALGWDEPAVVGYVSDLLADFTHVERLYRVRTAQGRRIEDVAEMLLEGDLLHRAASIEREWEVHKHIGDFTLFMTGLFPEYVRRLRHPRPLVSPDSLVDYVQTGKRSYRVASEFTHGQFAGTAPLFRKLSEHFELCVFGLGYVRRDLDRLRAPEFRRAVRALLGES